MIIYVLRTPELLATGQVYHKFLSFLPIWLLTTFLVALAAWLALRRFKPTLKNPSAKGSSERLSRFLFAPLKFRNDWAWLAGSCSLLLLATDYHGFTQAFFRWDDFSFIQATRETPSLPQLLNMYHSDHSLPLFRLWVSGLVALVGSDASAAELARAFNVVNYLTCLAVLLSGAALLARCAVHRITAVCFCLFAWCWPGWGEFTTGFYTLIVYPQTLVCGFTAITLLLHYLRTGLTCWLISGVTCTILACGLDVSGVWVFPAIGGFLWAVGNWRSHTVRRLFPWLLLAFALCAYYHLVWFKHPFSGRELVQNPSGQALNHSLLANLTVHAWKLPLSIVSGLGGTLLSEITPGFFGLAAPQFYGNFLRGTPIYLAEVLTLGGTGWLVWRHRNYLSSADRRWLAALAFPMLVLISMTSIARVHGLDLPGTLWPTKYLCLPQAWAVLAAVFLLDRVALRSPESAATAARWLAGALVAGIWLVSSFWYLERTLEIPTARRPAGRQGNTEAAIRRRAEFTTFQHNIEELAERIGRKQIDVPPPDGIYWAHPNLEFGYGAKLGGTYLFTDLLSVAPVSGITLRERPRNEVDADILSAIDGMPTLQRVFDPTPPLD